jgi:exosortase
MAEAVLPSAVSKAHDAPIDGRALLLSAWPAALGYAALVVPTVLSLSKTAWARESGAHGPLVLLTGLWLLYRQLDASRGLMRPGAAWLSALVLLPSLALYVFGRVFDFASLEAIGLLAVGVAILHDMFGLPILVKNWFALLYLGFAVPAPGALIDRITAPLKQFVSEVAMRAVQLIGVPASRQGVTISVSKYQLLMEDACSGMNSLIGLTAISLLYIYLLRGSSARYALLMTAFVIPIAIVGNILRVITLILLTYFAGDETAQGFLHYTAGFLLFGFDLLLVFALDNVLIRLVPASWRPVR